MSLKFKIEGVKSAIEFLKKTKDIETIPGLVVLEELLKEWGTLENDQFTVDAFNAGHKDFAVGVRCHLNPFKMSYKWYGSDNESEILESGLYYHRANNAVSPIWIANPIYVKDMFFDLDGDLEKLFRFKIISEEWVEERLWIGRALTMQDSFLRDLVSKGFIFDIEYKDKLINYLIKEKPRREDAETKT